MLVCSERDTLKESTGSCRNVGFVSSFDVQAGNDVEEKRVGK